MANDKKFVVKNGLTAQNVAFVDDVTAANSTITLSMLDGGQLSFSGSTGQLFSVTDSQTGTIFAVNDVSGVPSIEVDDDGTIRFAETFGNVLIGTNIDDGLNKLQVVGDTDVDGDIRANNLTITGDFTVSGNTYIVHTQQLLTEDPIITLNKNQLTPLNDIGIVFQRYDTANSTNYNVALAWEESSDRFIFGKTPEEGADADLSFSEEIFYAAPLANKNIFAVSGPSKQVEFRLGNTGGYSQVVRDTNGTFLIGENDSNFPIVISTGAPTNTMRITSSGFIGIGEPTPLAKLHVKDGDVIIEQGKLHVASSLGAEGGEDGGGSGVPIITFGESEGTTVTSVGGTIGFDGDTYSGNNNHLFLGSSDAATNEASRTLTVTLGGSVGIGRVIPTPTAKLHVVKSTISNAHYDSNVAVIVEDVESRLQIMANDDGVNASTLILSNVNKHWTVGHKGPSASNRFSIGYGASSSSGTDVPTLTDSASYFNITTNGNVGIGNTSPSNKLHVAKQTLSNSAKSNNAVIVAEGTDSHIQAISEDSGDWGSSLIMTNTPTTGNNIHWWLHNSPSTNIASPKALTFNYVETNVGNAIGGAESTSTKVMTLTPEGRVGIGTLTPNVNYKFHVANGVSYLQQGLQMDSGYKVNFGNPNQWIKGTNDTSIEIATAGGTSLIVTNDKYVGIGTTSPASKLNVVGGDAIVAASSGTASLGIQLKYLMTALPTSQVQGFIGTGDSTIGVAGDLLIAPRSNVTARIRFLTGSAGATDRMIIDSNGRVGIGTALPTSTLDVEVAATDGVAGSVAGSYPVADFIVGGSGGGKRGIQIGGPVGSVSSPAYIKVYGTSNRFSILDQNDTENFTILDDGNVGIGTNSPEIPLHLKVNDGTTSKVAMIDQDGSGDASLSFRLTGIKEYIMGIDNSDSDNFVISDSGALGTNNRLIISSAGAVSVPGTMNGTRSQVNSYGYWFAGDYHYLYTFNGSVNGSSGSANIKIAVAGIDSDVLLHITSKNVEGSSVTNSVDVYHTGTTGISIVAFVQPDGYTTHFYLKPTINIGYTPRVSIDAIGNTYFDSNPPTTVTETTVWDTRYANNLSMLINTIETNNNKVKFAVKPDSGQTPTISFYNGQVQVGGNDMNWTSKLYDDGNARWGAWSRHSEIFSEGGTSSYDIWFSPSLAGTKTERVRIKGDTGNVGIGTTSPAQKLHVHSGGAGTILRLERATTLIYETIIDNLVTGDDADLAFQPGQDNSGYLFRTRNSANTIVSALSVNGEGDVGIGNSNPLSKLHMFLPSADVYSGTAVGQVDVAEKGHTLFIDNTDNTIGSFGQIVFRNGNSGQIFNRIVSVRDASGQGSLRFVTGSSGSASEKMIITYGGNVGIGTSNPAGKLEVGGGSGATGVQAYFSSNAGYSNPAAANASHPGGAKIVLWDDASPQKASIGMDENADIWFNNSGAIADAGFTFYTGIGASSAPEARLKITKFGNVGIGTTSPAYKLEVNGSFAATTKSFVIDHPTKEGMKLRHGSLEGPEDGVYVRGRLNNSNVIELPDYWTGLVHEDSITVQLTAIGGKQELWVEDISDNKVIIGSEGPVNCFYMVNATRKDVDAFEVEYEE